jgi:hypothetical protein
VIGGDRPQHERGDMLGRDAQEEVGIDDLTLVMRLLGVGQPGKRSTRRGAR